MTQKYGPEIRRQFPRELVTETAGYEVGMSHYLFDAEQRLLVGIDYVIDERSGGFALLTPVYDRNVSGVRLIAAPGYAIAGLEIHAPDSVRGFRAWFMKVDGRRLDTSDSQWSDWHGSEPEDQATITLAGDGRPVYGVFYHGGFSVSGMGLIIDVPAPRGSQRRR